jgi:hypothetical protein
MSFHSSLKFRTADAMLQLIDEYFVYITGKYEYQQVSGKAENIKNKIIVREAEPPTLTGLALFLGFQSMDQFKKYEKRPGFLKPFRYAHLRIEAAYEQQLFEKPTGAIFALKKIGCDVKSPVTQLNKTLKIEITNSGPKPAGSEKEVNLLI